MSQTAPEGADPAQALKALELHNEQILQCAGEGIYGLDLEGTTTFVNRAAAEMLGWELEELVGKPQHAIIHHTRADGSAYPREACPIYAAFHDGSVHTVDDEVFWRKDGTSLPVEYTSTPIRDGAGALTGAVVTFKDITERTQRQAALEEALAEVKNLRDRLQAENSYLQQEIQVSHGFDEIIGQGQSLSQALHQIEQVAPTDATVLILGETGVGKELFARATHDLSPRKERPLVKVNCASLPATLIESELFGHEAGAFTGATAQRIGRFELADGGTVFLDEIGELPLELQAKLLRVLQEGEFERLGGSKTFSVDLRVIAATNRDLGEAVKDGTFRSDLYYRLNVFPIEVPALRDRQEDIPALVAHFVTKHATKLGKTIRTIPDAAQEALQHYDWPGNVRELQNVIERALILTQGGALYVDDVLRLERGEAGAAGSSSEERTLDTVQRDHILAVLDQTGWRVDGERGAAMILGLNANTLRSRMAKLGIKKRVGPA